MGENQGGWDTRPAYLSEVLERRLLLSSPSLVREPVIPGLYRDTGTVTVFADAAKDIYVTNGTAGGTFLLRNLFGVNNSEQVTDRVYVSSSIGLFRTDGTTLGTVEIRGVNANAAFSFAKNFVLMSGDVYFYGEAGIYKGIWRSDGVSSQATFIAAARSDFLVATSSKLYFAHDPFEAGRELWVSDGTPNGTAITKDIYPGTNSSLSTAPDNLPIARVGESVVFAATDGTPTFKLWVSDGTSAGTAKISSAMSNIYGSFVSSSNTAFFSATDAANNQQLWKSDGTVAGTALVKQLTPHASGYVNRINQTFMQGDVCYFAATNGSNGDNLWKSDGTAAGTLPVMGSLVGTRVDGVVNLLSVQGSLGFVAATPSVPGGRYSAWVTDGTTAGTVRILDLNTTSPRALGSRGSLLLFQVTSSTGVNQLWSYQTAPAPVPEARTNLPTPYEVVEGGSIALHGYASADPLPGRPLTYEWDLDSDGIFGETGVAAVRGNEVGTDVTFNAAGLDGPGTYTAQFRISDNTGYNSVANADIALINVAPQLNVSGSTTVLTQGTSYLLTLAATDLGLDTITSWIIDWGDGNVETVPGATSSVLHDYPLSPRLYGVSVRAVDEDGTYSADRAGALDSTFGTGGRIITDTSSGDDAAAAVATQQDGKIITATAITPAGSSSYRLTIRRYNTNGILDSTFGAAGIVQLLPGTVTSGGDIAVQPDGRIVVVGSAGSGAGADSLIFRLLPDGSLDPSFGNNGIARFNFGQFEFLKRVAISPEGYIVAGGQVSQNILVVQLTPTGAADNNFGTGGARVFSPSGSTLLNDLAVQPDGKVLLVPARIQFTLVRLTPNGVEDPTFGAAGISTLPFSQTSGGARSLLLLSDGKILLAGLADQGSLARVLPNGAVDSSFGSGGIAKANVGTSFLRQLADGRIISAADYSIFRSLPDGSLDPSFGFTSLYVNPGAVSQPLLRDLDIQLDGAAVIVGDAGTTHNLAEALIRLVPTNLSVRVVDAGIPQVSLAAPGMALEGSGYSLGLSGTDPDGDGIAQWIINWGDGNVEVIQGNPSSASHVYADGELNTTIKATAVDGDGSLSAVTAPITVQNVPPSIVVVPGGGVDEASPWTVSFSATDPGLDTISSWQIAWGDGSTTFHSASTTSAQHIFPDSGSYSVTVRAVDEDGTFAAVPVTAQIANIAPTLDPIPNHLAAAGASFDLKFTARDVVAELFEGTVDWGDGSTPTPFAITSAAASSNFAVPHIYADRGSYEVTVTLYDGDGGTVLGSTQVAVKDLLIQAFNDANGNGSRDASETVRVGASFYLDLDQDGVLDLDEPATTTDSNGEALFDGLTDGPYTVRAVVPPAWHLSTPAAGYALMSPGTSSASTKFGFSQVAAASGLIFNDANANGVQDGIELPFPTTVRARRLDTGTSVTIAASNGTYRFTSLAPGRYVIDLSATTRTITKPYARSGYLVTVTGEESEFTNLDFGTHGGTGGTVRGTIFRDLNKNGVRDTGEAVMANQTVYLDANDNAQRDPEELSAITTSTGLYTLARLPAGTFRIRQMLPPGMTPTPESSQLVTVSLGQTLSNIDLARPIDRSFYIRRSGNNVVVYNGSEVTTSILVTVPATQTAMMDLPSSDNDDWVTLDFTFGSPVPIGGMNLDLAIGTDTLSIIGSSEADTIALLNQSAAVNAAAVSLASVERFSLDGEGGWDNVSIAGTLPLTLADPQFFESLSVGSGSVVRIPAGGWRTLRARNVSVSGTLDLSDNAMILDYAGASPLSEIRMLVHAGYNNGTWDAAGIISSVAAGSTSFGLGYGEATDILPATPRIFSGVRVDSTAILFKLARLGDATMDNRVDTIDFNLLAGNFGESSKSFSQGNFSYDGQGIVDSIDFNIFLGQYGNGGSNGVLATHPQQVGGPFGTLSRNEEQGDDVW